MMTRNWILGASVSAVLHGGAVALLLATVNAPGGVPVLETAQPVIELELISTLRSTRGLDAPAKAAPDARGEAEARQRSEQPASGRTQSEATKTSADAAPASSRASSAAPDARLVSEYYRNLESHLARYHTYPGALRTRPRGTVQIGLIVRRDGKVMDVWIQRSSGVASLDQAALATVRSAEPLPSLPSDLPAAIDLVVPLNYEARPAAS